MDNVLTRVDSQSGNRLFWGCFIVLVASAFGFVFRSFLMPEWGVQFDLSKTEQGEIFGVSFWPFALSIVLFSLVVDRIGYKKAMIFAFVDRKSTRLNSSHVAISYAVFCLKKKIS